MQDSSTADFFDPDPQIPIARKRDPATSRAAATSYSESGQRESDKQKVLRAVAENPGHTSTEIAYILKERGIFGWHKAGRTTTKRISELIAEGKIRTGKPRKCLQSKHLARTHYAYEDYL